MKDGIASSAYGLLAMTEKVYCVYIMTNRNHTVLYVGVTGQLKERVYQHREGLAKGFTKAYEAKKLVYYEVSSEAVAAIAREKQIKAGSRRKKVALVDSFNPSWEDLYEKL